MKRVIPLSLALVGAVLLMLQLASDPEVPRALVGGDTRTPPPTPTGSHPSDRVEASTVGLVPLGDAVATDDPAPPLGHATISGTVRDANTGKQVPGCLVSLESLDGVTTRTDDAGFFQFDDRIGAGYLILQATGYERRAEAMTSAARQLDLGTIYLRPRTAGEVLVVDESGRGWPEAKVFVSEVAAAVLFRGQRHEVGGELIAPSTPDGTTDANGTCRINLPDVSFERWVTVLHPDAYIEQIRIAAGRVTPSPLRVVLRHGDERIGIRPRHEDGTPITNATVDLFLDRLGLVVRFQHDPPTDSEPQPLIVPFLDSSEPIRIHARERDDRGQFSASWNGHRRGEPVIDLPMQRVADCVQVRWQHRASGLAYIAMFHREGSKARCIGQVTQPLSDGVARLFTHYPGRLTVFVYSPQLGTASLVSVEPREHLDIGAWSLNGLAQHPTTLQFVDHEGTNVPEVTLRMSVATPEAAVIAGAESSGNPLPIVARSNEQGAAMLGFLPIGQHTIRCQRRDGVAWTTTIKVDAAGGPQTVVAADVTQMRITIDAANVAQEIREMLGVSVVASDGTRLVLGTLSPEVVFPFAKRGKGKVLVEADPHRAAAVHGYLDLATRLAHGAAVAKMCNPVAYAEWQLSPATSSHLQTTMPTPAMPANVLEIRDPGTAAYLACSRLNPFGGPPRERLVVVPVPSPACRVRLPESGNWLIELLDQARHPIWWNQIAVGRAPTVINAPIVGVSAEGSDTGLPRSCTLFGTTTNGREIPWMEFAVDASGRLQKCGWLPDGEYRVRGSAKARSCVVTGGVVALGRN